MTNPLNWTAPSLTRACFCVGPQNGDPVCPCRMNAMQIKDGRYIEVIDHGPVKDRSALDDMKIFITSDASKTT